MIAFTLAAGLLFGVNNVQAPFATTPPEMLQIVRYNAALTDAKLQDHVLDVTGVVTSVSKDGLGNYVAIMETLVRDTTGEYRATIRFNFDPVLRDELAQISPPGQPATIRGICRKIDNLLPRMTRNSLTVDLQECQIVYLSVLPPALVPKVVAPQPVVP